MPQKPRLIGDKDRLILQGDLDRLLAFLDRVVHKPQPPQPTPLLPRAKTWPAFWRTSRFAVRVLLQSGLRASELAHLTVADCDLASQPYRLLVRGGKKRRADEVDEVLIPTALARELRSWIEDGELRTEDPIIPNRWGRACSRRWIYELAKAPLRACKLNPKFSTHTYRHRFGTTLMQQSDGNLMLVKQQLRHRSLQPTAGYLHLADLEAQTVAAVDKLGLGPGTLAPARGQDRLRRARRLTTQIQMTERRGRR